MGAKETFALSLLVNAETAAAAKGIDRFASETVNKLHRAAAQSQAKIKTGLKHWAGGLAALYPLKKALNEAADFNDKMINIAKEVGVNVQSEAFGTLKKEALETQTALGLTTESMSELLSTMVASGAAKEELMSLATKSKDIGLALDLSETEAAKAFLDIRKEMQLTNAATMDLMDAINASTNQFGGNASQVLSMISSSGQHAVKNLRFTQKELIAFGNVAGDSGNAMLTSLTKVLAKNKDLRKMFVEAGGGAAGITKILDAANKSGNAFTFFDKQGLSNQASEWSKMAATTNSASGFKTQSDFMKNANTQGSVAKEALQARNSYSEMVKDFQSSLTELKITAGTELLPVVMDLMKEMKPLITQFSNWAKENPKLVGGIMKGVAAFAALKFTIGGTYMAIGGGANVLAKVFGFFAKNKVSGISAFGKKLKWVGGAFKSVKNSLGSGLFKARFFGEVYIKKATNSFRSFSKVLSGGFMKGMGHIRAFSKVLSGGFVKGMGYIRSFSKVLSGGFVKAISLAAKGISIVSKALMTNPIILIITGIAVAAFLIIKHWDKIKPWFLKLWDNIKKIFLKTWEWIKNMFLDYTPYGLIIKHWDVISTYFSELWDGIKNKFSSFIEWFSEKWKWVKDTILKPAGKLLGFGGGDDDINVSHNYTGGINRTLPQPVALASTQSNNMSFAPVINISGGVDETTANAITARMRRDYERIMNDYAHNQKRKAMS